MLPLTAEKRIFFSVFCKSVSVLRITPENKVQHLYFYIMCPALHSIVYLETYSWFYEQPLGMYVRYVTCDGGYNKQSFRVFKTLL